MSGSPCSATDPADAAWRFFLFNWLLIGAMATVLALGIVATNFSIELTGLAISIGYVGIYGGFAHANALSLSRRDPQVMFVLGGIAQVVLITAIMAPLTYVAAAMDLPLRDANLLAIDRALGFDWAAYVRFVDDRPLLAAILNCGYTMIRWPIFAIPVVLAARGDFRRIEEFTCAFGLALIATTVISALVPAIGVYQQIGFDPGTVRHLDVQAYLDQLRDLPPTRAGVLRHLSLLNLGGIVTFPSFHAASAVLYIWALWSARWIRPLALFAFGAMLAATPINGGHYLIDVLAGAAIAVLSVVAACRIGRMIGHWRTDRFVPVPITAVVPAE